jgi:hypothetical protein
MCVPNVDYFVLVGLNEETKILVKLLLYTGENCSKKIPRLGTSCTQSVNEGPRKKTATSLEPSLWEIRQHGCADFHDTAILFTLSEAANIFQQVQLWCLYF